mmetsp:Transcript_27423/g.63362  ORF Transcript_27423/g.63362 Transcript_27423/m.63362 type:complete len:301 (+) Transcript_27423:74-976(+)
MAGRRSAEQLSSNRKALEVPEEVQPRPAVPLGKGSMYIYASFLECFWDELCRGTSLRLSQLNNLYCMRSGQELAYKSIGYARLTDFLATVPGLGFFGSGNNLQVYVANVDAILRFSRQMEGVATPVLHLPQQIPEHLHEKLIRLFKAQPGQEIPVRRFLSCWRIMYPDEPLEHKKLGYPNVHGLLAHVIGVEKVSKKGNAKYVLTEPCSRSNSTSCGSGSSSTSFEDFGSEEHVSEISSTHSTADGIEGIQELPLFQVPYGSARWTLKNTFLELVDDEAHALTCYRGGGRRACSLGPNSP